MRFTVLGALGLALTLAACKPAKRPYSEDDATPAQTGAPQASDTVAPEPELPPGSISRARLDEWLLRGPAILFQRVHISDVHKQNKFVGWRLEQFPSEWDSSGLKAGDVVTSANGMKLESQDDFFDAWVKISDADEVHINYERDGKPAEAVLKIVGAANPETKERLQSGAPPAEAPRMSPSPQKRGTIIITDDSRGGD